MKPNIEMLIQMAHSPLHNYVLPGMTSYLMGEPNNGTVRLFVNSRTQFEHITPHSHRFDFQCQVLRGEVINIVFTEKGDGKGDRYLSTKIIYGGEPGHYVRQKDGVENWVSCRHRYGQGDWYSMRHDEVHSIVFSPDAVVLFFEGPQVSDSSIILEPWVNGEAVPTFKTEPWMFKREQTK